MEVALCIIATNDYTDFLQPLITSADKYFLQGYDVTYFIFSDKSMKVDTNRKVELTQIKHEPWPNVTLHRYKTLHSKSDLFKYDYVYYCDADMVFADYVGTEIFAKLLGVKHPGYARFKTGAWEMSQKSTAYVENANRKLYLAGGFQGGSRFYGMCAVMAEQIALDEMNEVMAKWHDESHWNFIYSKYGYLFTILEPDYCFPGSHYKAVLWAIADLSPKIIALEKEHSKYQQ